MSEPLTERAVQRLLAMAAEDEAAPASRPTLPSRYEIVRELGRGGMGIVYEAIDHQLGRRCAVKTLGVGPGADDEVRRRFAREAQAAARLSHPHIAAVHDATPDYISMQLVAGGPISGEPSADVRRVVAMVRDAANALHYAHEQGIVHRDLKPSNLLVENGHVFVVDFGLAKQIDATSSLSLSGALVGTPAFMPPEQALGHSDRIDARSDVYGLGATLFCCLRGAPPFTADNLPALLRRVVEDDPPRLGVDPDLDLVVAKCLQKEREQRYATARAFAEDLDRWLAHEPVVARPPSFGYRLKKRWQRQRTVLRAVAIAAAAAVVVTALVLVPIWWRENAARTAANEAAALADHVATVLQDAAQFRRLGDPESARQLLEQGLQRIGAFLQQHEVPRIRYLRSRVLRGLSRPDEALVEIDRVIDEQPDFADARFERGLMLAASTERTAAQTAVAIDDLQTPLPDDTVLRDAERLFGRAELLRLRGDFRQSMELLREVLEYDTMHVPARLSLARVFGERGLDGEALYWSASAVDLQRGLGSLYLARERRTLPTSLLGLDCLLVDFAGELHSGPDNAIAIAHRGIVQLRRALRFDREGRGREAIDSANAAIADYDQVLTVHDHLAGALVNRAACRLVLDRLSAANGDTAGAVDARAAATADLDRSIEQAPDVPEAWGNRGVLLLREAALLRSLARPADSVQRAEAARAAFVRALDLAAARPAHEKWPHASFCRDRLAAVALLLAAVK